MKLSHVTSSKLVGVALLAGLWALACSSSSGDDTSTGGSTAAGGSTATTGGKTGTGGSSAKTGGSSAKTGGASSTGGAAVGGTSAATGGVPNTSTTSTAKTGGTSSTSTAVGGTTSTSTSTTHTGGVTGVGGLTGIGGVTSTGGSSGMGGSTPTDAHGDCVNGCAALSVPLTTANTQSDFDLPIGVTNLTNATIDVMACLEAGSLGGFQILVQDGPSDAGSNYAYVSNWTNLSSLAACSSGTMTTVSLDLSAATLGSFDPAVANKISLIINAGAASDAGALEATTVYVESVTITGPTDAVYAFTDASKLVVDTITSSHTPLYPANDTLGINVYTTNVEGSSVAFYKAQ